MTAAPPPFPRTAPQPASRPSSSRGADVAAFIAGGLAAGLAMAVGEIAAGMFASVPSLVTAIGTLVIDLQPPGAKELVVSLFGEADKLALNVAVVVAAVLIAGVLGVVGRRRFAVATAGFVIAGGAGLVAALRMPLTEPLAATATVIIAVAAGLGALRGLLTTTRPAWAAEAFEGTNGANAPTAMMPDWERRAFLIRGGGVAVATLLMGGAGRTLLETRPAGAAPDAELPAIAETGPDLPPGTELEVEGVTPIVTPSDDFYRIDTALAVPRVDVGSWSLAVRGMVDREVTLSYEQLAAMPLFEQFVTIACVSNEVGGRLVGNALWRGVDLRDVLSMAGVHPDATQIVGRSVDGFTAGFPTAWAMDPSRRPMIALGMNGEPLPAGHGYPARLIIPGLYGYVSATKWLAEIELTTLEGFDAYWVPLGWAKEAPILTQSRIDVPRDGATLPAGMVAVAGVAWAPDRGVSAVEVRIDGGEWRHAETSEPLAPAAWVQWKLAWDAAAGDHAIEVRATDGEGVVQTDEQTSPAPDGARGHHSVRVRVA